MFEWAAGVEGDGAGSVRLNDGLGTYSAVLAFDGDTKKGVLSPLERMFDSCKNAKSLASFEGMSEGIEPGSYRVTITIERA